MILGQHFLDTSKAWGGLAAGKTVALVELAYARDATPGFDVVQAVKRLDADSKLLESQGVYARPYLRLDYSPTRSLADNHVYYRGVEAAMRLWPEGELNLIIGNEPNLDGGTVEDAAACVRGAVDLRDLLGYPVRIFAPAIAPWYPRNVQDPADFAPGELREYSTEWENYQFGLARRLANTELDGYAVHAYGRPDHPYDAQEPHRDRFESRGAQWGFRWYRDALRAIDLGERFGSGAPRVLPVVVSELNTRTDGPSCETYPPGWLPEALAELRGAPQVEAACYFVGEPHGGWADESLKLRTGRLSYADDDFNTALRNG